MLFDAITLWSPEYGVWIYTPPMVLLVEVVTGASTMLLTIESFEALPANSITLPFVVFVARNVRRLKVKYAALSNFSV